MTSSNWVKPISLTGMFVRLVPLAIDHIPGLVAAAQDASIWKYMVYGNLANEGNMTAWVHDLLEKQGKGTDLPFAVIHKQDGLIAGATRFMEIRPEHRSLEIGGTWYAPLYQRTAVNTECKYHLLKHAFEELHCIRVQFKADARNQRSIEAIKRLGAAQEGVLRNHYILPDGLVRDSVYFSLLDREWEEVKTRLEGRLTRHPLT